MLRAECDVAAVVFGAPFRLESDRQTLTAGKTFTLAAGETLRVGGTPAGARAYLAVRGGLFTPPVLGSRSELEPVSAGRELPCAAGSIGGLTLPFVSAPFSGVEESGPAELRYLDGAQADWFAAGRFAVAEYRVTPASNRMGLRLEGPTLDRPEREMVSEPVCPGTVQVTNEGRCIVLGVDGQTIGGYPKVAQVIRADLDRLGQLRPGRRVRFVRVGLAEAERAAHERGRELGRWLARLGVAERRG
jgi:antagonist of KipI